MNDSIYKEFRYIYKVLEMYYKETSIPEKMPFQRNFCPGVGYCCVDTPAIFLRSSIFRQQRKKKHCMIDLHFRQFSQDVLFSISQVMYAMSFNISFFFARFITISITSKESPTIHPNCPDLNLRQEIGLPCSNPVTKVAIDLY